MIISRLNFRGPLCELKFHCEKREKQKANEMTDAPQQSLQGLVRLSVIALSGAVSGFFGVLVGHPLDTLKVRLQVGWF